MDLTLRETRQLKPASRWLFCSSSETTSFELKDGARLQERVEVDIFTSFAPRVNHCWRECYKSPRVSARGLPQVGFVSEPFVDDEYQVWSAMSASSRKHSSSLHYCCSWRSHDLWVRNWWFPAELKLKCSFDALFLVSCSFWLFDGSLFLLFDACVSLILFHDHICF